MARSAFDPELAIGKKDDDLYLKHARKPNASPGWKAAPRMPPRKTFKRLGILLLVAIAIYVFIHNIPTDLGPTPSGRPIYTYPNPKSPQSGFTKPKHSAPNEFPDDESNRGLAVHDYNGPVRFLELAETLHAISSTKGSSVVNRNVLFAASSLKSANNLLPMACRMGQELRSYVHFALMSRSEISIGQLGDMNGIDESCQIIFHDARPEYSSLSTDDRLEKAVARALIHINNYMHPQAIVIDSSEAEEPLFLKSIRNGASKLELSKAVIELPEHSEEGLGWMTKLDAASLSQWNRVSIDILIHAHADASGSLIRVLESLSAADYTACAVPHLTIELPENIDPPTAQFLQDFQWPPTKAQTPTFANHLTLRHRILRRAVSEEESSIRFLESFWPANPVLSHVLVLSPQVELSPNFFHYLRMAVLEYRYSTHALYEAWDQRLMSISLDLPSTNLNGSEPFLPPSRVSTTFEDLEELESLPSDTQTTFLWQAPNSNAALFTGQKWAELHGFVSQLLEAQQNFHSVPDLLAEKSVSREYPAWMEYALHLCRARGYWTLYPSPELATNLATIHSELYQQPEEYENDGTNVKHKDQDEVVLRQGSFLKSLPNDGGMLRFNQMPLLSWDGAPTSVKDLDLASMAYATEFRQTVGGCEGGVAQEDSDLFCGSGDGI